MSEALDDAMDKVLSARFALYTARTRLMRDPAFVNAMTGPDRSSRAWINFILAVGEAEAVCDCYEDVIRSARSGAPLPGLIPVIARTSILDGVMTGGAINIYNGFILLALDKLISSSESDVPAEVQKADSMLGQVLQKLRDTLPADLAASFKVGNMIDYRLIMNQILSKALEGEAKNLAGELEGILDVPGRLQSAFATGTAYELVKRLLGPVHPGCRPFQETFETSYKRIYAGTLSKGSYRWHAAVRNFWEAAIQFALCQLGRVRNPPGGPTPA